MSDQHELPPESTKPTNYADKQGAGREIEVASTPSAIPSSSDPSTEVPLHAEGPEENLRQPEHVGKVAPQLADGAQADQQESHDSPVEAQTPPPDLSPVEVERQVRAADESVLRESRKHTRRSFAFAASGALAAYGFYHWLDHAPTVEMQPYPLRRAFQTNAAIARGVTRDHALAPTYSLKDAKDLRVNGVYGLKKTMAPESWRLQLVGVRNAELLPRFTPDVTAWEYRYVDAATHEDQGHDTKVDPNARTSEKMAPEPMLKQARTDEDRKVRMPRGTEEAGASSSTLMPGTPGLLLTMQDILALPRHELVTQFKCIEGWSEVVHWAGIRMSDFMEAYPPALIDGREPRYVYMETPDGDYYTGYDLEVCRHPQTLLVTEMMGAPLTQFHGAPLRLHMPTKYGYKQIKRIALISYTDRKPDDYWTKLGYDWYAGL
jgi:hypothetical protein